MGTLDGVNNEERVSSVGLLVFFSRFALMTFDTFRFRFSVTFLETIVDFWGDGMVQLLGFFFCLYTLVQNSEI